MSQIYKIVQKLGCSARLDQEVDSSHLRIMSAETTKKEEGKLMASESGMNRYLHLALCYIHAFVPTH